MRAQHIKRFCKQDFMVIREVTQIGNPGFRQASKRVSRMDLKNVQRIIKNLVDSMRHYELVGMAAPQIGERIRIFVTEIRKTAFRNSQQDACRIYINPKILKSSRRHVSIYEGCGSVAYANLFGLVRRPETVEIEAMDEHGNKFRFKAAGMLARVIQHECDHLDGICFIERVKDMKTIMSSGEYKKFALKK